MSIHSFQFILEPTFTLEDDLILSTLFEAGCDDALVGIERGIPYLSFEREAESYLLATLSALRDAETVSGVRVQEVRSEDPVLTVGEIAEKTERSRQSIHQLINGQRGPGDFPRPCRSSSKQPLYKWSEVYAWMERYDTEFGSAKEAQRLCEENRVNAILNGRLKERLIHTEERHLLDSLFETKPTKQTQPSA